MKKLLFIAGLFSFTVFTSCDSYEERRTERSEETIEDVEIEDEGNLEKGDPVKIEKDQEPGSDEIEVEK